MKKIVLFIVLVFCKVLNAQTNSWTPLAQTTNSWVYSLSVYNGHLIAVGEFSMAGSAPVNKIAAYDGTNWQALGKGIRRNGGASLYIGLAKTYVFNNELYVVGTFDSAGTVAAQNIAKWNGTVWSNLGNGLTGNGRINAITAFNNEIYVAGTFTSIGGTPAKNIAKWDGANWQTVGGGIVVKSGGFAFVSDLRVYNNELYAVGGIDSAGGIDCNNIARWNGTNWNNIPSLADPNNYFYSSLVYNNKLLIPAGGTICPSGTQQWDGTNFNFFNCVSDTLNFLGLYEYNSKLYGYGPMNIVVWNTTTNKWEYAAPGINDQLPASLIPPEDVYSLVVYNNELYCGGQFRKKFAGPSLANYIAKLSLPAGLSSNSTDNSFIKIYPNPANEILNIDCIDFTSTGSITNLKLQIINNLGQIVYQSSVSNTQSKINIEHLSKGIYIVELESKTKIVGRSKLVKQ